MTTPSVPAYRVTTDDLVDADKKLQRGIGPLLDALNRCLTAVIAGTNALLASTPSAKAVSFSTATNGAAYVTLGLGVPAQDVWVTGLVPQSGTLDSVYSMSWVAQPAGAQLLFVGLVPLTTYSLRVRWL